jgi:hypothetical protein
LLHVINIFADITTAVWPGEGSIALHLVIAPLSREDAAVSPFINA